MRQVRSIGTVSAQMHSHAMVAQGRISSGGAQHGLIGAHLLLSDALRLVALMEDIRAEAIGEIEILQISHVDNAKSIMELTGSIEWVARDRDLLAEVVLGLREAQATIHFELGEMSALKANVARLADGSGNDGGAYARARDTISEEILPTMYRMRDDLDRLLLRYEDALAAKETHLWSIETAFKYVLPLNLALKLRRRVSKVVDDGSLRDDLPPAEKAEMRALIERALTTKGTIMNADLRLRLEEFLEAP
jgi:hypothetical protein